MSREWMVEIHTGDWFDENDVVWCEREQCYEHVDEAKYVEDAEQYVTRNYDEVAECEWTNILCYNDQMVYVDVWDQHVSQDAWDNGWICCDECWAHMHSDDAYSHWANYYCLSCFNELDTSMPEEPRNGYITSTQSEHIPEKKQEVVESVPTKIADIIYDHYTQWEDSYYDQSSVERRNSLPLLRIDWCVDVFFTNVKEKIEYILYPLRENRMLGPYSSIREVEETSNTNMAVEMSYVDKFGNIKKREEPIANIQKFVNKLVSVWALWRTWDSISKIFDDLKKENLKYNRWITNDILDKWDFVNQTMSTCQTWWVDSNSIGYADLYLNWANALLFIDEWDRHLNWRALIRIMYDKHGNEYLFIDRLYTAGNISNKMSLVFWSIVESLIDKWYSVVVSSHSEHGSDNRYLLDNTGKFTFTQCSDSLRTPARKIMFNEAAYYSDSWVATFSAYHEWYKWYREKIKAHRIYHVTKK